MPLTSSFGGKLPIKVKLFLFLSTPQPTQSLTTPIKNLTPLQLTYFLAGAATLVILLFSY